LSIKIWLTYIVIFLILKLTTLLACWGGRGLESWDHCERVAQEEANDLASLIIREYLLDELVEARVSSCRLLHCLVTEQ
jgi:hypothetical protein